jgi:hypothetical protein
MPDGFYLVLALVVALLATGAVAAAHGMRRRAAHRASERRPAPEDPNEP